MSSVMGLVLFTPVSANDFGTLFTTASEREVIDGLRYAPKKKKRSSVKVSTVDAKNPEAYFYKTIEKDYRVSGISIAHNGADSVWINDALYEHKDVIDNKITVFLHAKERKVRLTVKNGKTYYGESGDTITVSYRERIVGEGK